MHKFVSRFTHSVLGASIVFLMTIHAANADVFHEKIDTAQAITQAQLQKIAASNSYKLILLAGNEPLEFELSPNESLLGKQAVYSRNASFYQGQIIGNEESWARFSHINGKVTGAFFDGYELFLVENASTLADSLSESTMQSLMNSANDSGQSTVLVKASDLVHNGTCGLHDHSMVEHFGYTEYVAELQELTQAVSNREIQISLIADTEFVSGTSDATADMISHLNVADGIFREQLNIQFSLFDTIELSDNGTLNTSNAEDLVYALRASDFENPGLRHLFTGKNLDGSTVGIAFVSSLCRSSSAGITQRFGASTSIIFAHELGHNFGAPHDSQTGSACSSVSSGFIMFPSVNSSGPTFSDCSLTQMQPTIDSATCLVDVVTDLAPVISSSPNLDGMVGEVYQYDSNSQVDVADADSFSLSLDIAPVGMTMDELGNIAWTPSDTQVGTNAVQITASNAQGTDTQFFEVLVEAAPVAPQPSNYIDFTEVAINSYAGQDSAGGAELGASNFELVLSGNTWKSIPFDYDVTPETMLEFEFYSDVKAEIQGIAFDDDDKLSTKRTFNVFGTQRSGNRSYLYTEQGSFQKLVIPVGEVFQGSFDRLGFVLDNDVNLADTRAVFRNVRVYEIGDEDGGDGGGDGGDNGEDPIDAIDLSALNFTSHLSHDKEGTIVFTDNGFGIELTGNRWRRATIDGMSITEDSVLRFEFKTTSTGEIHGLGFMPENKVSADRTFKVFGTQRWGIRDFTYDGDGEFQSFEIPIGQYFTDPNLELVIIMDHDVNNPTGVSHFRNISISE